MYSDDKYQSNGNNYYDCNMNTFSDRVRARRKELKMSQAALAKASGISQSTIAQIETGRNTASKHMVPLADALLVSIRWLVDGSGDVGVGSTPTAPVEPEYDNIGALDVANREIPVIGEVRGGPDGFIEQETLRAEEISILTYSRDSMAYGLRIRGDSMRPRFKPGEYLLIEPSVEPRAGDDVVIAMRDGRKMLKELVIEREDEIEVTSLNNGGRYTLDRGEIESIHRVGGHFVRYSSFVVKK